MRVLLTGATGFLGKRVLDDLLRNDRITEVIALSRKTRKHYSPKVKCAQIDLIVSGGISSPFPEVDAVIHLAGLYDFDASFEEAYRQNVLSTLNLISWIKSAQRADLPRVHFASTYAVGHCVARELKETSIETVPHPTSVYAHTKAVAEKLLEDSGLPVRIFRLGILVGDRARGEIDKADGPYTFVKFIRRLASLSGAKALPIIPVPGRPNAILPLVPVDVVAKVFTESLSLNASKNSPENSPENSNVEYFGVYNPLSVTVREVVTAVLDRYLPGVRPMYISKPLPRSLLRLQSRLTLIPADIFEFSTRPMFLRSKKFERTFGIHRIPPFNEFKKEWFQGFEDFESGRFAK